MADCSDGRAPTLLGRCSASIGPRSSGDGQWRRTSNRCTSTTVGSALLANPLLNKGTAFTIEERDALGLHGLLPTHVETIEERADRVRAQLALLETDLERHVLLRGVQDYDETLFLRVLLDDIVDAACRSCTRRSSARRARSSARSTSTTAACSSPTPTSTAWRRCSAVDPPRRGRGDRRHRRRAHPRPRRPGRRRPRHPDRQAVALLRLRGHRPGHHAARSCSTSAPTTRSGATTPTTSAGATSGSSGPTTTPSSRRSCRPS